MRKKTRQNKNQIYCSSKNCVNEPKKIIMTWLCFNLGMNLKVLADRCDNSQWGVRFMGYWRCSLNNPQLYNFFLYVEMMKIPFYWICLLQQAQINFFYFCFFSTLMMCFLGVIDGNFSGILGIHIEKI